MTENELLAYSEVCEEMRKYIWRVIHQMADTNEGYLPDDCLYFKDNMLRPNFVDIFLDRAIPWTKYDLISEGHLDKTIISEVLFHGWQNDKRALKVLIDRLIHIKYNYSLHSSHRND